MGVHIGRRTESLLRDGLQAAASVEELAVASAVSADIASGIAPPIGQMR